MDDLTRFWSDVVGRFSGPMSFRFILQPTMGVLVAAADGVKGARDGRPRYLGLRYGSNGCCELSAV
jgi:hypothetical protein